MPAPAFVPARPEDQQFVPARPEDQTSPAFVPARPEDHAAPQPQGFLDRASQFLSDDPVAGTVIGALKGVGKTAASVIDAANTPLPIGPAGTPAATGQPIIPQLHQAAEFLRKHGETKGPWEGTGNVAEMLAELMLGGEGGEAASLAAKAPASFGEYLSQAARRAKILENDPMLTKFVKLGMNMAKGGAKTGAELATQTGIKTGDPEKMKESGTAGALLGAAAEPLGAAAEAAGNKITAVKDAIAASEGAPAKFAKGATDTLQRAFDRLGVADKAAPAADYGQAAKQLGEKANEIYDAADAATNGQWRAINAEIQKAKGEGNKAAEAKARAKMEELVGGFDDANFAQGVREATDRARDAFHDHYTLDTIHDSLVKAFDFGTPETAKNVFNGKKLSKQLRNLETDSDVGRDRMIELMGEDGYKDIHSLSDIAQNPIQNQKITDILKEIINRAHTSGSKGSFAGGMLGKFLPGGDWATGAATGYATGAAAGAGSVTADKLLTYAATKPRLSRLIVYAGKHGVSTRYAATLLGEAFNQEIQRDSQHPQASPVQEEKK